MAGSLPFCLGALLVGIQTDFEVEAEEEETATGKGGSGSGHGGPAKVQVRSGESLALLRWLRQEVLGAGHVLERPQQRLVMRRMSKKDQIEDFPAVALPSDRECGAQYGFWEFHEESDMRVFGP